MIIKCAKKIFKTPNECLPSIVSHYGHELIICGYMDGITWAKIHCNKCNKIHTITDNGWV